MTSRYRTSAGLTGAQRRAQFEQDGYLQCRELVPSGAFASAHQQLVDLLCRAQVAEPAPYPQQPRYREHADPALDLNEMTLAVVSDERFEAVFHEPTVLAMVRELLGDSELEIFVHPQKVIRAVPPQHSWYYSPAGIHQDFPELQGSSRQVTVWFPMVAVTASSGALPVYPGSHVGGLLPLELQNSPSGWGIPAAQLPAPDAGSLSPGDAIAFTTFTAHGGSTNAGDGWRLSVECRYQPRDDPISDSALSLPGCGFTWSDVYAGWSELADYWQDRTPPVVRWDDSWERWRDVESIRLGRLGNTAARRGLTIAASWGRNDAIRRTAAGLLERL